MFEIVEVQGKPWVPADDLAGLLEYSTTKTLIDVYRKNKDEFAENDVLVVTGANRAESPNPRRHTYFSQNGGVLLCMFARTPRAKEARKLIGEGFLKWLHQKAAALPPAPLFRDSPFGKVIDMGFHQPELFTPPPAPEPQVEVVINHKRNTVSLTLPFNELHRIVPLAGAKTIDVPAQPAGLSEPPEVHDRLTYDFAAACAGLRGWYNSAQIAEVVGCTDNTVQSRCRTGLIPDNWRSQKKLRKWWLYIP